MNGRNRTRTIPARAHHHSNSSDRAGTAIGTEKQPVSTVIWVLAKELRANSYNPNFVARPELELLKLSIMEDGWTQPIVARRDGEIVDGFHRFHLASTDKEVAALTGGLVPVVWLRPADEAHQMMSTIRHNRARGQHAILKMGDIVRKLAHDFRVPEEDIMRRLGMEDEEVDRLIDSRGMIARGSAEGFANGWQPE